MLQRKFDLTVPRYVLFAHSVTLDARPEKLLIDLGVIKSRHWTAVQSEGASRDNQIRALQRAVPFCRDLCQFRIVCKQVSKARILRSKPVGTCVIWWRRKASGDYRAGVRRRDAEETATSLGFCGD